MTNGRFVGRRGHRTVRASLLTPREVAEILNVSLRSVRRLIAERRLAVVRIGRAARIRPESLETFLDEG